MGRKRMEKELGNKKECGKEGQKNKVGKGKVSRKKREVGKQHIRKTKYEKKN